MATPASSDGSLPRAVPSRKVAVGQTQHARYRFFLIQALIDAALLTAAFVLADVIRYGSLPSAMPITTLILVIPVYLVAAFNSGVYSYDGAISAPRAVARVITALVNTIGVNLLFWFAAKSSDEFSRIAFFVGVGLSFVFLATARVLETRYVLRHLRRHFMRRILIVDRAPLDVPESFEIVDACAIGLVPDVDDPIMLHNFSNLVAGADRVVVSCRPEERENWAMYLKGVGCWGELLVPELHGVAPLQQEIDSSVIGVCVSVGPLSMRNRTLKRSLDLLVTVPTIVLLTPVLILTAVAIKLDDTGPVLFRQRRMGRGNQLFDVYKFRSMRTDQTDHDGARSASRDDDRVTRIGRIIRATSIDELPQLFNVLEGDMSLVGPRPHALGSVAGTQLFWHVDQRYWLRHTVKPGITGLAQVRGHRGATDRADDLVHRLQSDLEYLTNWSIYRDIHILLRTMFVVVHKNAF